MNLLHHPMWLLPNGDDIPCPNWDHVREASKTFPGTTPEVSAMAAGWLKVTANGFEIGRQLTHAQRQKLEAWGADADAIESEGLELFRFHKSLTRVGPAAEMQK